MAGEIRRLAATAEEFLRNYAMPLVNQLQKTDHAEAKVSIVGFPAATVRIRLVKEPYKEKSNE